MDVKTILLIAGSVCSLIGFVDILIRNFHRQKVNALWLPILLFFPFFGVLMYYLRKPWKRKQITSEYFKYNA